MKSRLASRAVAVLLAGVMVGLLLVGSGCQQKQEAAKPQAPKTVKIGVIYPLSGALAPTGMDLRNGVELAVEIINNKYPDLKLPLAGEEGLANLGGAKIEPLFGDSQGSPEKGASEAERLISVDKAVALLGAYQSSVTATASQVAERAGMPYVNADSSSPALTERGFKWFFRTSPHDDTFAQNFFQFLDDMKKKGQKIETLALVYENTAFGTDSAKAERKYAEPAGYKIVEDIPYPAKSTNVTSEVQKLKAAKPDVVLPSSYVSDAILFMRTFKELNYAPPAILAQDAGFIDSEFLKSLGPDGDYILTREVWALDLTKVNPNIARVNDMFKSKYGTNMNGNSARAFTGMMVLADAINRAGSLAPADIQKALAQTDLKPEQLIMPWKGVKFDEKGQNVLGTGIICQVQKGEYVTIWPYDFASAQVVWPFPSWKDR